MSKSYIQSEIPKARINLKLDLHTGGASKKTERPLKLLVAGDFSHGQAIPVSTPRSCSPRKSTPQARICTRL